MKNIKQLPKQTLIYCTIVLLSILISLFTPVKFLPVILSVIFLCKSLPLPRTINYIAVRIVLAIALQFALFNIFGLFFYMISFSVAAPVYGITSLIATGAFFVTRSFYGETHRIKFSRFDALSLLPVVLGAVFFLLYLFLNHLSFSENLIRFIGSSSDQSAHLSMFNDLAQNDGNYLYFQEDKLSINTQGINSYPMGWHQAIAVLSQNIIPVTTTMPFMTILTTYFVYVFSTFLLCSVTISLLASLIYDKACASNLNKSSKGKSSLLSEVIIKSLTSLTVMFLFLFPTFSSLGYANYIYATALAFLCGILMIGIPKKSNISLSLITIFSLLIFSAAEAWYIMAIPLSITFLGLVTLYVKDNLRKILLNRRQLIVFILIFILLGITLLEIAYRTVITGGTTEQLTIGNAMASWLPNVTLLTIIVTTSILFINSKKIGMLHFFINSFFITIAILTTINLLNLQEFSYYQQKMLYAFYALGLLISLIIATKYFNRKQVPQILSLSILIFSIYMIDPWRTSSLVKRLLEPKNNVEYAIIDEYFQSSFNDESPVVLIKDYRTENASFTESYARLLMSKIHNPGECYNDVIMPLLYLNHDKMPDKYKDVDINQTALRCYGKVKFYILKDDEPVRIESLTYGIIEQ